MSTTATISVRTAETSQSSLHLNSGPDPLSSQKLLLDLSQYTKLTPEQAGHLRHFYNTASQLDGEWKHMGSPVPGQEFLDAIRYQLATMTYAAGVTHYHRLPALRSVFKSLIRQLIGKMLHRDVWGYWFNTSHSGVNNDPSMTQLHHPWADPPESLVFNWNPMFWGMGPERFKYDNRLLQKVILEDMQKNGWMGVCCEPNLVFVICNQFPLIAIRYNDVRDGTNVIGGVLEKYKAAWEKKTMKSSNGLVVDWWRVKQDDLVQAKSIGFTAWANAFMNTWNSESIYESYPIQSLGFVVSSPSSPTVLLPPAQASAFRKLVLEEKHSATSPETLTAARKIAGQARPRPFCQPTFGYVCIWLSELGKSEELTDLLAYADTHLNQTWEDGGLYYKRNDIAEDGEGNWTHMDAFSGNAAIGYSRLNVKDGQKIMWEKPWTREGLNGLGKRPWVQSKGLETGVDFLRGVWDEREKAMVCTIRTWDGKRVKMELEFHALKEGSWAVYENGELKETKQLGEGNTSIALIVEVGGEEMDVVLLAV